MPRSSGWAKLYSRICSWAVCKASTSAACGSSPPKGAIDLHRRFHRQTPRFLTAFVAAHAVRHNRQPSLAQELLIILRLPIAKRIFVVLAQAADVGLARYFDSGANLHADATSSAGMTSIGKDSIRGHAR